MKSNTDIRQGHILSDILSLKTADMYWLKRHIDLTESEYKLFVVDKSDKHIDFFNSYAVAVDNNEIIPCWSLSALLDILESEIYCEEGETYKLNIEKDGTWWSVCYKEQYDEANPIETESTEDLVDACYEMILKLHKQKLL